MVSGQSCRHLVQQEANRLAWPVSVIAETKGVDGDGRAYIIFGFAAET